MQRTSRPHVAVLGQYIPGTHRFSDMDRHPDNAVTPALSSCRIGLVYFNIEHVCLTILDRVQHELVPPRLVVLDLGDPTVDLQSAHALAGLADELSKAGSGIQVVEARWGKGSSAWRGT